ncbi:GNAT family N-acetyltransferase [Sinorhizobium meliloti]|uniref:GNAT family N-acetyltransferase n=1 Tax=Rhizobium meliloti TaxID=382 RepID=UPI003F5CCA00
MYETAASNESKDVSITSQPASLASRRKYRAQFIISSVASSGCPRSIVRRFDLVSSSRYIEEKEYAWVIDAGRFIGHLRFHSIDRQDERAALAIGIDDPAYLGRGFGTEAIRLALMHAFSTGLHRISLRVLASNTRAIACYRKCGFVEEGRLQTRGQPSHRSKRTGWHRPQIRKA